MTGPTYFERIDERRFRVTEHVGGAWDPAEQHIGPSLGLLAHLAERDQASRGTGLRLARATYDILGAFPVGDVEAAVAVVRPGRTIELVEVLLRCERRVVTVLRAWFVRSYDTDGLAATRFEAMPARETTPAWEPGTTWPGGFVRSVEVRRSEEEVGRARSWVRPRVALLEGEDVSTTARVLGTVDIANGLTPLAPPERAVFPNLDLTAHLFRTPEPGWTGLDTRVSIGADGLGLTHSVLHDEAGPLGTVAQTLTVRPA